MWTINCVKNTVKVSLEVFDKIDKVVNKEGHFIAYDIDRKTIEFDSDANEHMDFLSSIPETIDILIENKCVGDICFSSDEGDNDGERWGYRFKYDEYSDEYICLELEIKEEWIIKEL